MTNIEKAHGESNFPTDEVFTDFAGRKRRFLLMQYPTPLGHAVRASEDVDGEDGYVFDAFSTTDPYQALGDLRRKIRKLISVRHLIEEAGTLSLTHDRLRGRVDSDGVVVDGRFLCFDQLAELIRSYEGFQFDLRFIDPSDEIE
ncbi:DUF7713 domain-containing protein [Neorhodopirellula pilleata]|uniref:Uncharacterized protein n=1 Tax=Neorhodopirellula pilleata TaxID=2714738 RepID=A0A5C6AQJ5_9BACT|nr:hypothetical protein [Neorhodopirellula pilleata]TWU01757.1 hypothetical protein Pla100_14920 [Neorhodopirellula pilleata]